MSLYAAVLLAGGFGRRLGLEGLSHKSLAPLIDGRSILARMMSQLAASRVGRVVVVHFDPAPRGLLEAARNAAAQEQLSLTLVPQDPAREYGTLHALRRAFSACAVEGDCLVVEGDVVCEDGVISQLLGYEGTVLVIDDSHCDEEAMAAEVVGDRVVHLAKKRPGMPEFCGLFRLSHSDRERFLAAAAAVRSPEPFYEDALNLMASSRGGFPRLVIPADLWIEIDTIADLNRAARLMVSW